MDGRLDGFQFAGVFCSAGGDVQGAQVAGIYTDSDGDVDGAQVAGIWCAADGNVTGGQFSGIWNSAHDVSFVQSAGIFNVAEGRLLGVQASGIFNIAEGKAVGVQAAGIFNSAADIDGVQASGILNVAENVKGVQAGLLNFGGVVHGAQIGLVNISDELHGLPIGLINISGNGLSDVSVWYSDNGFVNFGYQLGTPSVYTFMNAGFSQNWTDAASLGLGMGVEIGGDALFIDIDAYGKAYQAGMGGALENIQGIVKGSSDIFPALRLTAGVELFDILSIFGGVNLDCYISADYDGYSVEIGESAAASYRADNVSPLAFNHDYGSVEMYPTWFVGVRI